jgi:hypothetical protein
VEIGLNIRKIGECVGGINISEEGTLELIVQIIRPSYSIKNGMLFNKDLLNTDQYPVPIPPQSDLEPKPAYVLFWKYKSLDHTSKTTEQDVFYELKDICFAIEKAIQVIGQSDEKEKPTAINLIFEPHYWTGSLVLRKIISRIDGYLCIPYMSQRELIKHVKAQYARSYNLTFASKLLSKDDKKILFK